MCIKWVEYPTNHYHIQRKDSMEIQEKERLLDKTVESYWYFVVMKIFIYFFIFIQWQFN